MGVLVAVNVSAGEVALAVVNMVQVVVLAYLGMRTRDLTKQANGHGGETVTPPE